MLRDRDTGETRDRRPRARCSSSSAPRRAPTGSTAWSSATSAGSCCTGPDLVVDGQAARPAGRWTATRTTWSRSVPGRVRRRRRARRVGQAGRLGGRRGRDGRDAGAPVPGGAVTTDRDRRRPHRRPTSCATLFLFEHLDDEQLAWLAEHGDVVERAGRATSWSPRASRPTCFYVLLSGHDRAEPAGRRRRRSRSPAPTSAASYAGAVQFYLGDQVDADLRGDRCARSPTATFFALPAARVRRDVPRAGSRWRCTCCEGLFLGHAQQQRRDRRAGAAAGAGHAVGRADPRAEQPRRRGRSGPPPRCATGSPACGTSWR